MDEQIGSALLNYRPFMIGEEKGVDVISTKVRWVL